LISAEARLDYGELRRIEENKAVTADDKKYGGYI
jgi:hypothetical protein